MYFEKSSLAKRYIDENSSAEVESILQETSQLAVSIIAVLEILSGLNRYVRERSIISSDHSLRNVVYSDITQFTMLHLISSGCIWLSVPNSWISVLAVK